jgi:MoaD family protein
MEFSIPAAVGFIALAGVAVLNGVVLATDVRHALDQLERDHPELYRNICDETGKVRQHLNVFVNTENVRELSGLDTKLAPGDELTILPAVSGG